MFKSKFTLYLERRDEETRKRDVERAEEARKRDAERAGAARKRDEEGNARWAQLQQLRERAEAREKETRDFNREILLRNEKVYTSLIVEMEEGRQQIREGTKQLEEGTKQIQANTQAVLSVLDRFNGSS